MEHVHGQFLIEVKLLETLPATVGNLGTNPIIFNYIIYIDNLASDKIVCLDLYQLHSLQSDHQ